MLLMEENNEVIWEKTNSGSGQIINIAEDDVRQIIEIPKERKLHKYIRT